MTTQATEIRRVQQFIGGEWVDAAGGSTFDDLGPVHRRRRRPRSRRRREDARGAVEAAAGAFAEWSQTPPAERQRIFLKAADLLESARTRSSPCSHARPAAGSASACSRCTSCRVSPQAAALPYGPLGEVLPTDTPGRLAMGLRRPVGVVGAIAPWNAALILSARSIAAPLALGNTVVLKPSEGSPIAGGLLWAEIFGEAGPPAGALNVVTHAPGEAEPIGDELVENPASGGSTSPARPRRAASSRRPRPAPEARRARARRLQPADRARGRRPRVCRQRVRLRRVPAPGPDLHVDAAGSSSSARSPTHSASAWRRRPAA